MKLSLSRTFACSCPGRHIAKRGLIVLKGTELLPNNKAITARVTSEKKFALQLSALQARTSAPYIDDENQLAVQRLVAENQLAMQRLAGENKREMERLVYDNKQAMERLVYDNKQAMECLVYDNKRAMERLVYDNKREMERLVYDNKRAMERLVYDNNNKSHQEIRVPPMIVVGLCVLLRLLLLPAAN
ncbi:hypothetical protein Vretimale_10435 [Volvox reticuliferus]|uniref:Uncharacterized protein n=1 Tax=Volvox reticuliferus TaxID=1737510 RepID=A0A8J4GEH4_9CHLO|nr:hypothetical protein Vretifemale_12389 [Volvox reticuliferus]GIM06019.1 hypothetical protein Vretimale_10435 [Volvox reticuliferus]